MPQSLASPKSAFARNHSGRPFFGLIDAVVVEAPVVFEFDGSVSREHAFDAWTWIYRDLAPELIDPEADDRDPLTQQALVALLPELLGRVRTALAGMGRNRDADRRLKTQAGGDEAFGRLPVVLAALRCRTLIEKAQAFGRAANGMQDDAALVPALQAMPLSDPQVFALLMHAAVGQLATPSRLTAAATRIAGGAHDAAVDRAGLGPVIDAMLAHMQNQLAPLGQAGTFADVDLVCRAIDRFHRLSRAVNTQLELGRGGNWLAISGELTRHMSDRIEPRVRDAVMNVNIALRRHRDGADRIDSGQLLAALNDVYVLATVRDCRDSLALNAVFDPAWAHLGQALEIHLERNLDMLRANPADSVASERLDAAIKMAELRFNLEYAEVLRRAKEAIEKR